MAKLFIIVPLMLREMSGVFQPRESFEELLMEQEKKVVQCPVKGMNCKLMAF